MFDKLKTGLGALNITWLTFGKWATILILVLGSFGGYTYYINKAGKDSMRPEIARIEKEYSEFRMGVKHNHTIAARINEVQDELYKTKLLKQKLENEIAVANISRQLDKYERDRMRDKRNLRASERKIHSLSTLLEIADRKNGSADLAERLEYFNRGVAVLADRGDKAIQRTIQCKKEIQLVPNLVITE